MGRQRYRPLAWLLAFCLLLAQQAGFAHGYSHPIGSPVSAPTHGAGMQHDESDGTASHFCSDCLAFAGCHSFVPAAHAVPGAAAAFCGVVSRAAQASTPIRREDCRTRAPPGLS